MATEWVVEAKAGGKCLVRVVHSLFASTDEWDNQLGGTEQGWPGVFKILRLYLTYFRGMPSLPVWRPRRGSRHARSAAVAEVDERAV